MKRIFLIALGLGLVFTACKKDDEPNIKEGKLAGSTWVYTHKFSNSAGGFDYTYTFKFTSNDKGTATQTGWSQSIENVNTWKMGPQKSVNKTHDFTYIYSKELKTGVFTCSSGDIFKKGEHIFEFSSDFNKMSIGSTTYTRK